MNIISTVCNRTKTPKPVVLLLGYSWIKFLGSPSHSSIDFKRVKARTVLVDVGVLNDKLSCRKLVALGPVYEGQPNHLSTYLIYSLRSVYAFICYGISPFIPMSHEMPYISASKGD